MGVSGSKGTNHTKVDFYYPKLTKIESHSDMGSLTLLFRQPVAGLQVLSSDGSWKWVRPQTDALTVNIADALQFLTSELTRETNQ